MSRGYPKPIYLKDVTRFSRSEIMIGLKRKQFAYSG